METERVHEMKTIGLLFGLVLLLPLWGCSGSSTHGEVEGTVTYQGEPIPEGQIIFRLADNSIVEGAIIEDGTFKSTAPIGNCLVQITARKPVDANPIAGMAVGEDAFATVSYIPTKYNDKSTLSLEVKSGSQVHDFLLE